MIEIWQNKTTGAPSVQVGAITVDLGKETPLQSELFQLVMNHTDAVVSGAVRAPLTPESALAFARVIQEEVDQHLPKKMGHSIHLTVTDS